ncbi:MAG: helix-turn-helix transcriptional regulator [Clostridia bacterium]|nr:helix-turn-helix transcriptional regulator [Clostridia bacterium]
MDYIRRMRDLREDADRTQQQIAEVLGTSQTMYARYERGANELPIRHLLTLCRYYHVSADYLLGLSDEPGKPSEHTRRGKT